MTGQHRETGAKIPDHCSGEGASALAHRIVDYWSERGQTVVCTVLPVASEYGRVPRFDLRSDMSGGLPRRTGSAQ